MFGVHRSACARTRIRCLGSVSVLHLLSAACLHLASATPVSGPLGCFSDPALQYSEEPCPHSMVAPLFAVTGIPRLRGCFGLGAPGTWLGVGAKSPLPLLADTSQLSSAEAIHGLSDAQCGLRSPY